MQGSADLSELHALYFDVLASSDSWDPTNPLCIVSPQCELYTWEENRNAEDRWRKNISVNRATCPHITDESSSAGWGLKNIYEEVSGIFEAEGEMQFSGNHGNFSTRSQQKVNAPVQRSFTPVTSMKEQQKTSSIKSQQRSNSPARSQQRSSSPANLLQRGSSPVPSLQRSFSPVRCQQGSSPVRLQQRSSSPVGVRQRSSSPVWSQHRSSSPVQSQQRSFSPLRSQQSTSARSQRSSSPVWSQHRSSSPVQSQQRSFSPLRSQQSTSPARSQRSASPVQSQQRSFSPLRSQQSTSPARSQRSSSPVWSQYRSSSPVQSQQRSFSPLGSQQSTSPARSQRSSSPVTSLQRNSIPLKTQHNESSYLRSPQKKTSPTESYPRNPTYVKEQQRCASPIRIQQRSVSPARTQCASSLRTQQRSTSPARTQLRSTSPARTPPRSISPARSQPRISSPFKEQQKSLSSVNMKRSTSPSPSYKTSIAHVGHTGNVSQRSSVPKTVSAESTDKNFPRKEHVDTSRYGTNKVGQSTFSSHGSSRACQDPPSLGVSRRLTSSTSSLDSECSQRGSSSRTHYTTFADIPRTKRLKPDLATLKIKGRTRSPGKAEVERMFGQERRTAEALEAFQALESGLIGSLSGKCSLTEQRRARRQSTPCIYPEESVRMRQELRMRRASLHPPPRTDMGRTTFREPEWINRDKILRPVGAQDKKEEKKDKNTELAWKNRETFLKSTPLPVETSHEYQGSTHCERRSKENYQTSISRVFSEPTLSHFGSSQYQKPERSQKVAQQYKPSTASNPESYYTGCNPLHQSQHRPSCGSLLENEPLYVQANSIQEAKIGGRSQYKPAGPLSCHTPEPQKQQFLGFSEIENVPLKIELRAAGTQTDQETSANGAAPCRGSPKEPSDVKPQGLPLLSDTKLQSVREPSSFPPESDIKAYTPPETMKRELQRTQTPSPNSSCPPKPYTNSEESNLKDFQKSSAPNINHNDFTVAPFKTPPRTEPTVFDGAKSQQSNTEKSLTKGMIELDNRERAHEDRSLQQSHPPPSSSPEQADSDQEPRYYAGRALYKPAGPLSGYRSEPQGQIIVKWYSGTDSPLSTVMLKPTRTVKEISMNVTSESAQQSDSNNSQDVDTLKESRCQNICDRNQHYTPEARSRPCTPSGHLNMEPAEPQIKTTQKGRGNLPSPEHISYNLKELHLSNASEMLRSEITAPCSKTSYVTEDLSVPDEKSLTKQIPHFQHCDYSSADVAEYDEVCGLDMYLSTMATDIKPDLLNFKKGWMSLLDANGEWKKHWFVLTDSSLRYYRDSNAEEADELDGEIDLRTCTDVPEFAVQRNYGFQIHTSEGVFTLSAMTSGIRRNWIEALRKNVHPVSIPDVTKLSESNKENTFVPTRQNQRPDELRLGSEVRTRKVELAGSRQGSFDYVELSPLSPGEERDHRSEERRRWFEAPSGGDSSSTRRIAQTPLTEEQKLRLGEDIEAKWKELERLPLRETKQSALTCLLGGSRSKTGGENTAVLEKQIHSLKMQLEKAKKEIEAQKGGSEGALPHHGYISQEACENSLSQMENSHKQLLSELQRHHEWEIQRLRQEKDQLLAEEAAATASVIDAIRAAHKEELQREVEKARTFQHGGSSANEMIRRQHQSDMEAVRRELQTLSERYSQKCLEIGTLTQAASERERELQRYQQEVKELLRHNQELNNRLSEEIAKLRSFMAGNGPSEGRLQAGEKNSAELEVLLRVKENELQYLRKEVSCLREDLQNMQKDKRYASEKYKDIYVELNNIKSRSEREIDQLKEHLRLAMSALREEATMRNSVGE